MANSWWCGYVSTSDVEIYIAGYSINDHVGVEEDELV
jgi:hypothetical protein